MTLINELKKEMAEAKANAIIKIFEQLPFGKENAIILPTNVSYMFNSNFYGMYSYLSRVRKGASIEQKSHSWVLDLGETTINKLCNIARSIGIVKENKEYIYYCEELNKTLTITKKYTKFYRVV